MAGYRDELGAARTRIRVLEAQLQEQRARNTADRAAMTARQTELEVMQLELEQAQAPSSPRAGWGVRWELLAALAAAALLVSIGLSEAINRAERARSVLRQERLAWQLERADQEFALAAMRAENHRLRRAVQTSDADPQLVAFARDPFAAPAPDADDVAHHDPDTATTAPRETLLRRFFAGTATPYEVGQLRALCHREEDACYGLFTPPAPPRRRMLRELGF